MWDSGFISIPYNFKIQELSSMVKMLQSGQRPGAEGSGNGNGSASPSPSPDAANGKAHSNGKGGGQAAATGANGSRQKVAASCLAAGGWGPARVGGGAACSGGAGWLAGMRVGGGWGAAASAAVRLRLARSAVGAVRPHRSVGGAVVAQCCTGSDAAVGGAGRSDGAHAVWQLQRRTAQLSLRAAVPPPRPALAGRPGGVLAGRGHAATAVGSLRVA